MKSFYITTAVFELGAGLALLCLPSASVRLLVGAPLEGSAALTVARVGGAALTALAVACWLAREDTKSRAARGIVAAMLLYNLAAAVILAYAGLGLGLYGIALWPAVVIHLAMSGWCVVCLRSPSV